MVFDRRPDTAVEPKTAAFLRFVLSPAGQALVARDGACLPLSSAIAAVELKKLE